MPALSIEQVLAQEAEAIQGANGLANTLLKDLARSEEHTSELQSRP